MNNKSKIFILIMALIFPISSNAFCFLSAGQTYEIDPLLLISIANVESSMNPKAIGLNKKNGVVKTEDLGLMQINTSWLPKLGKSFGITREKLLNDPCQNVYVGAYILANNISSNGVNWESIGAYNAGFKKANNEFRLKYAKKVYNNYIRLLSENREHIIAKASRGERV
ncbi:lytic transglycosylase domain-containing protein [Xenorhabdus bovienii]|uniref:lytic transglycosylase domain-containing protein n=1 Tax=Xenorhabdus bovienii TaxID=40576 RepID=UPI003DA415F0